MPISEEATHEGLSDPMSVPPRTRTPEPSRVSAATKHTVIADDLRRRLRRNEFKQKIPGQRVLAAAYKVNFLTVRKAVSTLVKEGILVRQPGRGTFVTRLKRQKTHTIAAVFGGLSFGLGGQHAMLIQGIQEEASLQGYDVILRPHHGEPQIERQAIEEVLKRKKVDGVLIWPTRAEGRSPAIQLLTETNMPFSVMVRVDSDYRDKVSYVIDDVYQGGYAAARHLIDLGHRRIGYLARAGLDGGGEWFEEERWRGCRQAQVDAGLAPGPRLEADWIMRASEARTAVPLHFLSQLRELTGLFCMNDWMALAFLNLQKALGLHIPEDLSLVGYDDLEGAKIVGLTTMKMPMRAIGIASVQMLLDEIERPRQGGIARVLLPELVVRSSSLAPRTP